MTIRIMTDKAEIITDRYFELHSSVNNKNKANNDISLWIGDDRYVIVRDIEDKKINKAMFEYTRSIRNGELPHVTIALIEFDTRLHTITFYTFNSISNEMTNKVIDCEDMINEF